MAALTFDFVVFIFGALTLSYIMDRRFDRLDQKLDSHLNMIKSTIEDIRILQDASNVKLVDTFVESGILLDSCNQKLEDTIAALENRSPQE